MNVIEMVDFYKDVCDKVEFDKKRFYITFIITLLSILTGINFDFSYFTTDQVLISISALFFGSYMFNIILKNRVLKRLMTIQKELLEEVNEMKKLKDDLKDKDTE
jgi:uncharacterized membrane-anchored protein YitT (DUF2179 family)